MLRSQFRTQISPHIVLPNSPTKAVANIGRNGRSILTQRRVWRSPQSLDSAPLEVRKPAGVMKPASESATKALWDEGRFHHVELVVTVEPPSLRVFPYHPPETTNSHRPVDRVSNNARRDGVQLSDCPRQGRTALVVRARYRRLRRPHATGGPRPQTGAPRHPRRARWRGARHRLRATHTRPPARRRAW